MSRKSDRWGTPVRKDPVSWRPLQAIALLVFLFAKFMFIVTVVMFPLGQRAALAPMILYILLVVATAVIVAVDHRIHRNDPDRWKFLGPKAWKPW